MAQQSTGAGSKRLTKGQLTRQKILEAAVELFAENGFERTSFREIGDACGMSQQGVMGHFRSKDELFFGVVDLIKIETYGIVEKLKDPKDSAFDLLIKHHRVQIELVSKKPAYFQIFILMYYYSSFNQEVRDYYGQLVKYTRELYQAYLYAGQREGVFKFDESVEELAELLHESLQANLIHYCIDGKRGAKKLAMEKWFRVVTKMTNYSE